MKTIEVEKLGGPEVLRVQDRGSLELPEPGQALVRIVYAGVNFIGRRPKRSLMCQNRQPAARLAQQNSGRGIQDLGCGFHIGSVI